MSLCRLHKCFRLVNKRCFASIVANEEEYTATPQYPPILDLSYEKRLERKKEAENEKIKKVKTVEEKQIKLNMPKYYGFRSNMILEDYVPYNFLPLTQHVTRTHLILHNKLPAFYDKIKVDPEVFNNLKFEIEEALLIELEGYQRIHDFKKEDVSEIELENILGYSVSKQINRLIMSNLAKVYPHLINTQVDLNPRLESCWYAGGMNPPKIVKAVRKGMSWMEPYVDDPVDRLIYYIGSPNLTLRSELPLLPVIPYSEAENPDFDVPFFQYDPRVVCVKTEHRHMANVPGFWAGDPYQFGLISYHNRGHILSREKYKDLQDNKEALHCQGILASFAWLHAQANHLGFTTYNDITYPLVTQTVISNGKEFSFYVYQLNTILMYSKHIKENPKKNICWATDELKLFEEVKDGKLIGFNEDVAEMLFKFYCNTPEAKLGVNLTPYLSSSEKIAADYNDEEKREWLEREYKYLMSNRPRLIPFDEIYSWEKIYKIDNKTRFMDKRLRFFELFKKPQNRRLDERKPRYIPRKLRPDLPRWKGRYAKEYFP